ncbi:AzlD domain-containing protein [Paracandidimonas soli]|uniref:Branched-subunit amino acid transport protein n=1 Tax=Paracandidimonas soli TaxID=1917182 RepID=A0A4R3V6S4_9BURK|nr:AzlD domain-containing protein [Paracandidimonas soli]TCU99087.1 branched-subunit amino acid transport protein [Paracandidimonas soli]
MSSDAFDPYILAVIAMLLLCSVLTRVGFFLFGDHVPLSEGVRRALRYAPAAALAAIIVPGMLPLAPGGTMTIAADQLLASLVAIFVCLRTRNAILVIVVGMAVFWGLRLFFSGFGG